MPIVHTNVKKIWRAELLPQTISPVGEGKPKYSTVLHMLKHNGGFSLSSWWALFIVWWRCGRIFPSHMGVLGSAGKFVTVSHQSSFWELFRGRYRLIFQCIYSVLMGCRHPLLATA